jgi:hypothetical protein
MTTIPRRAGKIVITIVAASCGLLALACPDWRAQVRAEGYAETEWPDLPPGGTYDGPPYDDRHVEPRYLVTYMISDRFNAPNSASVVSVTNLTQEVCHVSVEWFRGFDTNENPSCVTDFALGSDFTADFCSRDLPAGVTVRNSTCDPELDFHEGRSIVGASCDAIGVSGRVYYTGRDDTDLEAITDSKIVRLDVGNQGD